MYQSNLDDLRDYILTANDYFDKGFSDVYQDEKTGIIHNDEPVFPNDDFGAYFYLRLPKAVSFDYSDRYLISDCARGIGMKATVILVACVRGADSSVLMDNLLLTLRNYVGVDMAIKAAIFNKIEVVMQELSKVKDNDLIAALQKVNEDYTMVSITFETTKILMPEKITCIVDPCKAC